MINVLRRGYDHVGSAEKTEEPGWRAYTRAMLQTARY